MNTYPYTGIHIHINAFPPACTHTFIHILHVCTHTYIYSCNSSDSWMRYKNYVDVSFFAVVLWCIDARWYHLRKNIGICLGIFSTQACLGLLQRKPNHFSQTDGTMPFYNWMHSVGCKSVSPLNCETLRKSLFVSAFLEPVLTLNMSHIIFCKMKICSEDFIRSTKFLICWKWNMLKLSTVFYELVSGNTVYFYLNQASLCSIIKGNVFNGKIIRTLS